VDAFSVRPGTLCEWGPTGKGQPSKRKHKRPTGGRKIRTIAGRFEKAKVAGKLGRGTVARVARERGLQEGASPTIAIRLAEEDRTRARAFAAEKGLRYETYLKMLLHQALNSEEKRAGRRSPQ
jgi:Uncharacterized protein conserved in bacteria